MPGESKSDIRGPGRTRYQPALSAGQKASLKALTVPLALLGANSIYLLCIPVRAQNSFYFWMFLAHLVVGIGITLPFLAFAVGHLLRSYQRPNRRAVKAGAILFAISLVVILSGFLLCYRQFTDVPAFKEMVLWLHRVSPVAAVGFYIVHRKAGPVLRWKWGIIWGGVVLVFVAAMGVMHMQDPRRWQVKGGGENYFMPSSARTSTGGFINAEVLSMDQYCKDCHQDAHETWLTSAHHFSSFNNLPYRETVRDLKKALMKRDGNTRAARWCAGCHDPVPFFSGAFDDPNFDDESGIALQGLTCTACHAITHINSIRGNADYTIEEPLHYPFAHSTNRFLKWVNHQLVKAKPEFHKRTFLKPFHRTARFCSVCHKVSLIEEVNDYKWLRGQDHYDSWQKSGVSGQGASSFYYPPVARKCSDCHMPMMKSQDFGNIKGAIHDHFFLAANTGLMTINAHKFRKEGKEALAAKFDAAAKREEEFLKDGKVRVDILGLREGEQINGKFLGPIRPDLPVLEPGKTYLVEVVVRTLGLGHDFTQGTVDSNQVWVELRIEAGEKLLAHSGLLDADSVVDPWAHHLNALVLDQHGNRIDRRNGQDIYVALYNHNIPPGAAQVVHYQLRVPLGPEAPLRITARVNYRKFDQTYMRFMYKDRQHPALPVVVMAEDSVLLPVRGLEEPVPGQTAEFPSYLRMNDYGIGLLLDPKNGIQRAQTRQATEAFKKVIELEPDFIGGHLNLGRAYLKDGWISEARGELNKSLALMNARQRKTGESQNWWQIFWWGGQVKKNMGMLNEAAEDYQKALAFKDADRGFDFSHDRVVLNALGRIYSELYASREDPRHLEKSLEAHLKALEVDPENLKAHKQLSVVYSLAKEWEKAQHHRELHLKYKPDELAREQAVSLFQKKHEYGRRYGDLFVIYRLHENQQSRSGGSSPKP